MSINIAVSLNQELTEALRNYLEQYPWAVASTMNGSHYNRRTKPYNHTQAQIRSYRMHSNKAGLKWNQKSVVSNSFAAKGILSVTGFICLTHTTSFSNLFFSYSTRNSFLHQLDSIKGCYNLIVIEPFIFQA